MADPREISAEDGGPFSLTVLTPTFDRADRLPELYRSLLAQDDDRMEWLIVDDGSRDGTGDVVASLIAENRLRIRYLFKENGGKHTALNFGLATVTSRLTIIVDSDDRLVEGAVRLIESYDRRYRGTPRLAGFSFTRIGPDGSPLLLGRLPQPEFVESYIECRLNRNLGGDMAEVFYTDILRAYPFPTFPGERFIAEDVVWIRMAFDYDLVYIDRPVYVCQYLPGGLTQTGRTLAVRAPLGAMERAKLLMDGRCCRRCRLRGAILFVIYGRFARKRPVKIVRSSGHPSLCLIAMPVGLVLHRLWRTRYA